VLLFFVEVTRAGHAEPVAGRRWDIGAVNRPDNESTITDLSVGDGLDPLFGVQPLGGVEDRCSGRRPPAACSLPGPVHGPVRRGGAGLPTAAAVRCHVRSFNRARCGFAVAGAVQTPARVSMRPPAASRQVCLSIGVLSARARLRSAQVCTMANSMIAAEDWPAYSWVILRRGDLRVTCSIRTDALSGKQNGSTRSSSVEVVRCRRCRANVGGQPSARRTRKCATRRRD
jgi:hypothetical protein